MSAMYCSSQVASKSDNNHSRYYMLRKPDPDILKFISFTSRSQFRGAHGPRAHGPLGHDTNPRIDIRATRSWAPTTASRGRQRQLRPYGPNPIGDGGAPAALTLLHSRARGVGRPRAQTAAHCADDSRPPNLAGAHSMTELVRYNSKLIVQILQYTNHFFPYEFYNMLFLCRMEYGVVSG